MDVGAALKFKVGDVSKDYSEELCRYIINISTDLYHYSLHSEIRTDSTYQTITNHLKTVDDWGYLLTDIFREPHQ